MGIKCLQPTINKCFVLSFVAFITDGGDDSNLPHENYCKNDNQTASLIPRTQKAGQTELKMIRILSNVVNIL